ncbi:CHAT domain-containing protein [Allocoleopsis sp.]|uniref:CHAT domain-containing protein n=1 Tax=Allocoleopsis sp. TaxID=3088169 RepID=UPI002FD32513
MARKRSVFFRRGLSVLTYGFLAASLALGIGLSQSRAELGSVLTNSQFSSKEGLTLVAHPPAVNPTLQGTTDTSQLVQQGRELYQAERFSEAAKVWRQAAEAYQAQKDELNQAMLLSYLSLAYQQLGQLPAASEAITSSLKLLHTEQGKNNTSNRSQILAQALNTQGSLQLALGQAEQAVTTWQRAASSYAQVGDEEGRMGSLINLAQAQQVLGLYLPARKTLASVEQALQNQQDLQIKATGLRSLGNILQSIGEIDQSRRVLEQSLAIARSARNANAQQLQSSQDLSATLLSLGNTARLQKDTKAALTYYQQAATQSASPTVQIQSQLNQLSLLLDAERWSDAQTLASLIQRQITNLPLSQTAVYTQINFAQSLLKMGKRGDIEKFDPLKIAQLLATAIQQAKNLGDSRAESYAQGNLGKLYEQTQQWSDAQKLTEQALLLAQAMNASDITYQWQWQLGRILKAKGEIEPATDAYKVAFNTLQSVRKNLVAINRDVQFSFRESVEPVYRQLVDLLLQPPYQGGAGGVPSQSRVREEPSQANLKQARDVIESLQLAELDNFFRTACLEGQAVAIDQIAQTEAAVIYPIILEDRLDVILSLPQQPLHHYAIPVSRQKVEDVLAQLRINLEKPYTTPEGKSLAQQVYDWLLRPIEANLAQSQVKTLVFVLDGGLRNVPMAALYDGKHYLVEKYAIALTPGLRLLNPKPLKQEKLKALLGGLTEQRHGFIALLNVNRELDEIKSEVPSLVLLNQSFTSSALQNELDAVPFTIVHLATHGQFSSDPEKTFILAWDKPINVNELKDLLRSKDETGLGAIELLVLSACETAEGDKRAALGLAGVAVQAGARSTLASLWTVDDESGTRLISQFYRELATRTVTKAEALRQAQLSLLRDPDYRYPALWAPYVIVGNWL